MCAWCAPTGRSRPSSSDSGAPTRSISAATGARFSLLPPENASGNYVKVVQRVPVRIAIDQKSDAQKVLRPGMSVVATVQVESKK